jgi:type IV secretion system protein VirB2
MIRHALRVRRYIATAVSVTVVNMMLAPAAYASGSSMPWEAPLQSILESIEGPVAKIIAVMIIIITGLTLAFGDTSGGARKLIQIVFGLSIAFAASSFFLSFFSFGGGAVIILAADPHANPPPSPTAVESPLDFRTPARP